MSNAKKDHTLSCQKFEIYETYNKKREQLEGKKDQAPVPATPTE
jgi:hypothetical protein